MTHQKPTQEELDSNIKDTLSKLDTLSAKPKEEVKDESIDNKPVEKDVEPIKTEDKEPERKEDKAEEKVESPPVKGEPNYKEKFIESTREAQKLYKYNVEVLDAIDEADKIPVPTDEDMKKEYQEWDLMSETEKHFAKDSLLNKKKFSLLHQASQVTKKIQDYNEKVDKYVKDPQVLIDYPELDGREEEFKIYATGKEAIATDMKILTSAFLHDIVQKTPVAKKGKMFETGSGGPNDRPKPKSDKISLSTARVMMKTNYNEFREALKSGKIDMSDIQ